jgi:hypothetical protein
MNSTDKENHESSIKIGAKYLLNLSQTAQEIFEKAIVEYANRLRREAEDLEKSDHVGGGSPEITGAHVEDAKFITLRRMRKASSSKIFGYIARLVQFAAAAIIGVGGSNFKELWGSLMCVGGVLVAAIFIVLEVWKNKEL